MGEKSQNKDDSSNIFSDDITRENTDDWGEEKKRKREYGYDEEFLGSNYIVELPRLSNSLEEDVARTKDGEYILDYMHFSITMSKSRGLAFYTAVNIDGNQLKRIKRSDKWEYDNRIDREYQYGQELYSKNDLDRGHLVRRNDPNWGSLEEAKKANEDTFHFTNCSPQHKNLNQKTWLNLEDYILNNTRTQGLKVSVFTGPVFRSDDMIYRNKYKIPAEFWKIAVMVKDDGKLSATAYLQTQKNMIDNLEFAFGEYETYQVPIEHIENITGLDFGKLREYDPVANIEVAGLLISDEEDIRL